MSKIVWYARRLRSMNAPELAWRVGRAAKARSPLRRRGEPTDSDFLGNEVDWDAALQRFRDSTDRPILLNRPSATAIAAQDPDAVATLVAAADRVVDYRFQFFGYAETQLRKPIEWNYDPVSDVRWPSTAASKIDHRTFAGDVKWIWELNRLQHLPWLAQAWLFTGDRKYSDAAFEQLDSWLDQNPPGHGIAWRGAFEAGIRAVSVAVALQGLRDSPALTVGRYRRIVRMLAISAQCCWTERSRFSSANNHLVGELAGLAVVAILFPELADAPRWERRAVAALAVEADRQILADGIGAEQAVGYQVFTAELLLVVAALLRTRDGIPPTGLLAAIERGADFLAAVVGDNDPDPRFGDDDEGFALRLGPEPVRTVRDHIGIVAAFVAGTSSRHTGQTTLTEHWYARVPGNTLGKTSDEREPRNLFARDGGLVVLRSGTRRLTMDVAPLGYLSIAAHGHADALALTLAVDGRELIGDPGAGSYYGHPDWRPVHRGTRAHGTVEVDGADQSVIGGAFLWVRHARTSVHGVDLDRGIVDAEHDGYRRLEDPVTHRRLLIAPPHESVVLVLDLLSAKGTHTIRTSWPLHPELDATSGDRDHTAHRDGTPVLQILHAATGDFRTEQVRGDAARNIGWWSDRLESRVPSWLVGAAATGAGLYAVATLLNPVEGDGKTVSDLAVELEVGRARVTWIEGRDRRTVSVDTTKSADVVWNPQAPANHDDGALSVTDGRVPVHEES